MTITDAIHQAVLKVPASAGTPAIEPDGEIRDGAWIAELDADCLKGWPTGMRLVVRKERPHPGAQLRITDADGMRLTAFATNTKNVLIAALELRHRQRARAEDRIRAARATGLRNLPLHDAAQNQIWLEIVQIALDVLAWMPMLALSGKARCWEPRRLRFRLFTAAGNSSPPAVDGPSAWPGTGPGPATSRPHSNDSPNYRAPADQRIPRPFDSTSTIRTRGARRRPETTLGPSSCPPQCHYAKTVHRLRRRTVTKIRG